MRRNGLRRQQLRWHPWWEMCMRWKGGQALTRWEHPAAARYLENVLRKFPVVNTRTARIPLPPTLKIDLRYAPQMHKEELPWGDFGAEVLSSFYQFIGLLVSGSNRVSSSKIVCESGSIKQETDRNDVDSFLLWRWVSFIT